MFGALHKEILSNPVSGVDIVESSRGPILTDRRSIEDKIPRCYQGFKKQQVSDKIATVSEGTLFYIFYMLCGEETQTDAYNLLLDMGWMYNTHLNCFFQAEKSDIRRNHHGKILVFDYHEWEKIQMDVLFDDHFITGIKESENIEERKKST